MDGIIGLTYNPNLVIGENTFFVSIDRSINPGIPCVTSDNFAGGQPATGKLADLGCKNLVFLQIGSSLENEPDKQRAGFENACLSRGLKYELKLLNDGESFEDVQVIGFDGIRSLGNIDYICSTIIQPVPEIAEMCVELLQDNTSVKPPLVCFPVTYVYGGSTSENLKIQ